MTFGEARTILRNDMLAELSTDYFGEEELLRYLQAASRELAQAHQFPTDIETVNVAQGATNFTLASGSAALALNEVAIDGFELKLVPLATVLQYRLFTEGVRAVQSNVRYYTFDPRRGDVVEFAPRAPRAGVVTYEAVLEYDAEARGASDSMWDGLFPSWHYLIIHRAAAKAFEASLEEEKASYHQQKMMAMQQEFSAYLNRTPIGNVVVAAMSGQQAPS